VLKIFFLIFGHDCHPPSFKYAVMYQIASKSDASSLRCSHFTIFKMADLRHLEFRGPIMGSLKSPIETITLECLVIERIAFRTHFDRLTRQSETADHTAQ